MTQGYDIIGDVHGCAGELQALLAKLGYHVEWSEDRGDRTVSVAAPHGRKAIFAVLHRNAQRPGAYFNIPSAQVMEIGVEFEI